VAVLAIDEAGMEVAVRRSWPFAFSWIFWEKIGGHGNPPTRAWLHHQDFKWEFLARIPQMTPSFTITPDRIQEFVQTHEAVCPDCHEEKTELLGREMPLCMTCSGLGVCKVGSGALR
jgi:hypothetical protein